MLSYSKTLTILHFFATNRKSYLQLRPDFSPRSALSAPAQEEGCAFSIHSYQPHSARLFVSFSGTEAPRGKGTFMTFDLERYRAHIAPLNLTTQQEDELLRDLWSITEALVDQSFSSPTYPLQLAVACEAFDALEDAIAVESRKETKTEETS
jgi:hypothetical protein